MLLFESSSIGRSDGKIAGVWDGRDGRVLVAVPLGAGAAPAGLGTGLLFGRTSGSAAFGRRILITGAPFGPVGVRAFEGFVGVDILPTYKTELYEWSKTTRRITPGVEMRKQCSPLPVLCCDKER